jgi:hypothetical protein
MNPREVARDGPGRRPFEPVLAAGAGSTCESHPFTWLLSPIRHRKPSGSDSKPPGLRAAVGVLHIGIEFHERVPNRELIGDCSLSQTVPPARRRAPRCVRPILLFHCRQRQKYAVAATLAMKADFSRSPHPASRVLRTATLSYKAGPSAASRKFSWVSERICRICVSPRAMRDLTVPVGTRRASAIS